MARRQIGDRVLEGVSSAPTACHSCGPPAPPSQPTGRRRTRIATPPEATHPPSLRHAIERVHTRASLRRRWLGHGRLAAEITALAGLSAFGAEPKPNQRIVREGKIVTAAGVSAGIDLALWLAGQIAGAETAEAIQLLIEYDPQPPYDSGHFSKASAAVKRKAAAIVAREGAQLLARDPKPFYGKRPRYRPCSGKGRSDAHAPTDAGGSRDPSKPHSRVRATQARRPSAPPRRHHSHGNPALLHPRTCCPRIGVIRAPG
jgi:hypothetical protein